MDKFRQTGGIRVGSYFNATWPFARIEITEEKILISVFKKSYEFDKNEQFTLTKHQGLFSKGLLIKTSDISDNIIFWSFDLNNLVNNLESRGYTIS